MSVDFIKGVEAEGKEKHVPVLELGKEGDNDVVDVIVGKEVAHPNTEQHFIQWVELYGEKKENGQVLELGKSMWTAVYSDPKVRFRVKNAADFSKFHAVAYCNIHGVWSNTIEV